jgi:hypothetical protein
MGIHTIHRQGEQTDRHSDSQKDKADRQTENTARHTDIHTHNSLARSLSQSNTRRTRARIHTIHTHSKSHTHKQEHIHTHTHTHKHTQTHTHTYTHVHQAGNLPQTRHAYTLVVSLLTEHTFSKSKSRMRRLTVARYGHTKRACLVAFSRGEFKRVPHRVQQRSSEGSTHNENVTEREREFTSSQERERESACASEKKKYIPALVEVFTPSEGRFRLVSATEEEVPDAFER